MVTNPRKKRKCLDRFPGEQVITVVPKAEGTDPRGIRNRPASFVSSVVKLPSV